MKQSRKKYSPEFKTKVVLSALQNQLTVSELIEKYEPMSQHRFLSGNPAYSDKRFDELQEDLDYYDSRPHCGIMIAAGESYKNRPKAGSLWTV